MLNTIKVIQSMKLLGPCLSSVSGGRFLGGVLGGGFIAVSVEHTEQAQKSSVFT